MKTKTKNAKNRVTNQHYTKILKQYEKLALHNDLIFNIEDTKQTSQTRVVEVKQTTYGEAL